MQGGVPVGSEEILGRIGKVCENLLETGQASRRRITYGLFSLTQECYLMLDSADRQRQRSWPRLVAANQGRSG